MRLSSVQFLIDVSTLRDFSDINLPGEDSYVAAGIDVISSLCAVLKIISSIVVALTSLIFNAQRFDDTWRKTVGGFL